MADDGDRILNLVGVALVLAILAALVVLVLGAMSAPTSEAPDEGPTVDWRLERINETHVQLVHDGGEPVPTSDLLVTVDGSPRHPTWSAATLSEGDRAVLLVRTEQTVRLYWTGTPGDRDLLERWVAP